VGRRQMAWLTARVFVSCIAHLCMGVVEERRSEKRIQNAAREADENQIDSAEGEAIRDPRIERDQGQTEQRSQEAEVDPVHAADAHPHEQPRECPGECGSHHEQDGDEIQADLLGPESYSAEGSLMGERLPRVRTSG